MWEIVVWVLISVNTYGAGSGQVQTVRQFQTKEQCEQFRSQLPKLDKDFIAKCIEDKIWHKHKQWSQ